MTDLREKKGLTRKAMARKCKCGGYLLEMLEAGQWITTPLMAKDLARGYGMTKEQRQSITYVRPKQKPVEKPDTRPGKPAARRVSVP